MPVTGGVDANNDYHPKRVDAAGRALANPAADRAADKSYNAIVTAHAVTARWTYTVPAGREAIFEACYIHMDIPTVGNTLVIDISLNRSGSGGILFEHWVQTGPARVEQMFSHELVLLAGDTIQAQTFSDDAAARQFIVNGFIREIDL